MSQFAVEVIDASNQFDVAVSSPDTVSLTVSAAPSSSVLQVISPTSPIEVTVADPVPSIAVQVGAPPPAINLEISAAPETQVIEVSVPGGPASSTLTGPEFTYTSGRLSRIDYDDGSFKTISYAGDLIDSIVLERPDGSVLTKTFVYSGEQLIRVDEVLT